MRSTSAVSAAVVVALAASSAYAASNSLQVAKIQGECGTVYTVVSGDGCWGIADNAKITQEQLAALNPSLNCATLAVGDGLCLFRPCATIYTVQSGDWCAKIQDEQKVSADAMTSLNPGLDCNTIFAGQRLCVAAPPVVVDPGNPGGDPLPDTPTYPPAPTYSCNDEIPITLGDTCYDLAVEYNLQLSIFTTVNNHLDCAALNPGSMACIRPKCGGQYRVQSGDWCAKIEGDFGLASGQLVKLNPGLDCNALAADQSLCIAAAPAPETFPTQPLSLKSQDLFPGLAPGEELPQTPVISFANSENPRDTFIGNVVFLDNKQHSSSFAKADVNSDGKITLDELQKITKTNNQIHRGMQTFDASYTADNVAAQIMKAADTNGDGSLTEAEYLAAVALSQSTTNEIVDEQTANMQRRALGMPEKRIAPIVIGIVAFLTLLFAISASVWMEQMEMRARQRAAGLLDYLDVRFWDRGNEKEPTCSVYMYYSTSCAALGTSWASDCSEGGEKVFPESCNGLFTDGAKACGFLNFGCSSMCYKISTDNCDCDALNYIPEEGKAYTDTPYSTTNESGVGPCRTKCSNQTGCVGFTVSATDKDNTVSCKIFKTMNNSKDDQYTSAFKLVGAPVGSGTNPICPAPPSGYAPYSAAQIQKDHEYGEALSNRYAANNEIDKRKRALIAAGNSTDTTATNATTTAQDSPSPVKRATCSTSWPSKRGFTDLNAAEAAFVKRSIALNETVASDTGLARRATPHRVDLRTNYHFTVKNQGQTGTCASHSFTTMMEGSIMKQYGRGTPKDMSVTWIARCRAGILSNEYGAAWNDIYGKVKDSYQATESCMPWGTFSGTRAAECKANSCAASQYGKLPYIQFTVEYGPSLTAAILNVNPFLYVERMKETLVDYGPIWMVFRVTDAFQQYASSINSEVVFYDGDTQWQGHGCGYVEHAMTVVGYSHHTRVNDPCGGDRLYWIVQNSWGAQSGHNGYVYIELGSLASTLWTQAYSVKVNEGTQLISSRLPTTWD